MNPDFVNINGEKIAIEVYNNYWKEYNYGSVNNYVTTRKKSLSKYGWNVIFIHDSQMFQLFVHLIKRIIIII